MIETKRIIITGTHLTPALELIHQLETDKSIDWKIYYLGREYNSASTSGKSIESQIIPKDNIKFFGIPCGKFDRRWLPNTITGIPQIFSGFKSALKLMTEIKPHLIVSFGGYVSVPVVIAGFLKKIPSITHEQTLTLSLSTKINSIFSRFTALSFPLKTDNPKFVVTGNLLRREIFNPHSKYFENLNINLKKYPLIYLTAGNQGSHHLNMTLKKLLPFLTQNFTIIHQVGAKDYPYFKKLSKKYSNYFVKDYIESKDVGWIFKNTKLLICRAGANTIQEIATLKLNSIVVPLPISQQNEQVKNAFWLQKQLPKNTIVINDKELTSDLLDSSIYKLLFKKKTHSKICVSPNHKLLKLLKRL